MYSIWKINKENNYCTAKQWLLIKESFYHNLDDLVLIMCYCIVSFNLK